MNRTPWRRGVLKRLVAEGGGQAHLTLNGDGNIAGRVGGMKSKPTGHAGTNQVAGPSARYPGQHRLGSGATNVEAGARPVQGQGIRGYGLRINAKHPIREVVAGRSLTLTAPISSAHRTKIRIRPVRFRLVCRGLERRESGFKSPMICPRDNNPRVTLVRHMATTASRLNAGAESPQGAKVKQIRRYRNSYAITKEKTIMA